MVIRKTSFRRTSHWHICIIPLDGRWAVKLFSCCIHFHVIYIHQSIERKSRVTGSALLPSCSIHMCTVACIFTSNNRSTKPGWRHYCGSEANYSIISPQGLQQLLGFQAGLMIPREAVPLLLGSLLALAMSLALIMLNT